MINITFKKGHLPFALIIIGCLFGTILPVQAQSGQNLWIPIEEGELPSRGEKRIEPAKSRLYRVDFTVLKNNLMQAPIEVWPRQKQSSLTIELPVPEGGFRKFQIMQSPVMAPALQAKYPQIRTFTGHGADDPRETVKLDITPHGFHAMFLRAGPTFIIDPVFVGDTQHYMVYSKTDLSPRSDADYTCHWDGSKAFDHKALAQQKRAMKTGASSNNPTGPNLRNYRIAISAAGEYSVFHGGTVPLTLAAIATSLNRINQVYEKDLTIRMILVPNNDTLIFTDPNTDPFSTSLGPSLGVNDSLITARIGSANYDIGHVFTIYGGGLASWGVCQSSKARAGTGIGNPVGDIFDVDYVCHEIGHQFTGGHTFNYCPGPGNTPVEPGSGSTIQGYAGLCGSANVDNQSVDQFSVVSYDEIVNYTHFGGGNCPQLIPTGNSAPVVQAGSSGYFIPNSTPFELTGSAVDIDLDSLTYSWEQFDLGPNTHPDTAIGNCPLFKVNYPLAIPSRIFPKIDDIVTGSYTRGEKLPDYGRLMTFRLMVRDGHGGVDWDELHFYTADSLGPFAVTHPNAGWLVWNVGSVQTVTWDIAGSDQYPINCQKVDVFLSEDGGYTYPHTLALNRDNIGSTPITVPNITGTQMRVKVKSSNSIFFDISNNNFAIVPAANPDFTISVNDPSQIICGSDSGRYLIDLDTIDGFVDPVNLSLFGNPPGTNYSFSSNPTTPPGTAVITVSNTGGAVSGNYTMTLQASSTSGTKNYPLTLGIRPSAPLASNQISPFNGTSSLAGPIPFIWNADPWAWSYTLELSKSPAFAPLEFSVSGHTLNSYTTAASLDQNTIYYWRVRVDSSHCGTGPWSQTWSFQTQIVNCNLFTSADIPITIDAILPDTITSTLSISKSSIITDLNVIDLKGNHTYMNDLIVTLFAPDTSQAILFDFICGSDDDFWLSFDDTSTTAIIPCPPTTALTYQSEDPLSVFNGINGAGLWTLEIIDNANGDGGALEGWGLEICGPPFDTIPPTLVTSILTVRQGMTGAVTPFYLNTQCSDTSANPVYTLVTLPGNGDLLLNGNTLAIGDTFSQADIDGGVLSYQHDNSLTTSDSFEYTVGCSNGGYIGGQVLQISIGQLTGIPAIARLEKIKVFPNPNSGSFTVSIPYGLSGPYKVQVLNLLGQRIHQVSSSKQEVNIQLGNLSSGIYICEVKTSDVKSFVVKMIVN
jgi:subtilisin-like proprotein convertase family protein